MAFCKIVHFWCHFKLSNIIIHRYISHKMVMDIVQARAECFCMAAYWMSSQNSNQRAQILILRGQNRGSKKMAKCIKVLVWKGFSGYFFYALTFLFVWLWTDSQPTASNQYLPSNDHQFHFQARTLKGFCVIIGHVFIQKQRRMFHSTDNWITSLCFPEWSKEISTLISIFHFSNSSTRQRWVYFS